MAAILTLLSLAIYQISAQTRPNFIFVITDDQDKLLDSMNAMPKTIQRIANQGITMQNSFAATPVCCM